MLQLVERNFHKFFRVPFVAYGEGSPYVSQLRSDLQRFVDSGTHPTFGRDDLTYFTVERDGELLGRIVAHVHRASNDLYGQKRGYFGYFEVANDLDAARMLLGAAENFARQRGCVEIAGAFNLTAMQCIGVVTEGFEQVPYTDQAYNPPYVPALLEQCGYEKFFPMSTFEFDVQTCAPRLEAWASKLSPAVGGAQSISVRSVTRWGLGRQLEHCRVLLNEAFAKNPMFVPLTHAEFHSIAKDMMWVIDPRISVIAFEGERPVGALLCIPDLNPLLRAIGSELSLGAIPAYWRFRRNRTRAVIIYYAVLPEYQNRGVNGLMMAQVFGAVRKAGYSHVGGTWIADSNGASLHQAEKTGAKRLHRTSLFRKTLA